MRQQLLFFVQILGDHKVVWMKGRDVLSAGPILLSRDSRYKLQPSSNGLELNQIRPQDAGDFACQLQIIGETLEVTHTVEVLGKKKLLSGDCISRLRFTSKRTRSLKKKILLNLNYL
jgi:hypothetical protein